MAKILLGISCFLRLSVCAAAPDSLAPKCVFSKLAFHLSLSTCSINYIIDRYKDRKVGKLLKKKDVLALKYSLRTQRNRRW